MLIQPADNPDVSPPLESADSPSVQSTEVGSTREAATPAPSSATSRGLLSVGLLIALAMIGGLAIVFARKRMLGSDHRDDASGSLMDDLRGSLRDGTISQEEFDAAKRSLVARLAAQNPIPNRKK